MILGGKTETAGLSCMEIWGRNPLKLFKNWNIYLKQRSRADLFESVQLLFNVFEILNSSFLHFIKKLVKKIPL